MVACDNVSRLSCHGAFEDSIIVGVTALCNRLGRFDTCAEPFETLPDLRDFAGGVSEAIEENPAQLLKKRLRCVQVELARGGQQKSTPWDSAKLEGGDEDVGIKDDDGHLVPVLRFLPGAGRRCRRDSRTMRTTPCSSLIPSLLALASP